MEDSEDAAAPLRNSGILSVSNPVASKIPALLNEGEEGGEVTVFVTINHPFVWPEGSCTNSICKRTLCLCASGSRRQEAGDILENHPAGPQSVNNAKGDESQVATRAIHPNSPAGDAKVLAGRSENNDVWPSDLERSFDEVLGIDVS